MSVAQLMIFYNCAGLLTRPFGVALRKVMTKHNSRPSRFPVDAALGVFGRRKSKGTIAKHKGFKSWVK